MEQERIIEKIHPELSHEMEDGFFDYPDSNSYGRAIIAFVPDRILGFDCAYISRKKILLSLHCDDSKGSALIAPNSDKGDQRA